MTPRQIPDPPEGQTAVSAKRYARLSPYQQGYVSYMQAAWNSEVPDENPHDDGTDDHRQWSAGNQQAMMDVQDGEE